MAAITSVRTANTTAGDKLGAGLSAAGKGNAERRAQVEQVKFQDSFITRQLGQQHNEMMASLRERGTDRVLQMKLEDSRNRLQQKLADNGMLSQETQQGRSLNASEVWNKRDNDTTRRGQNIQSRRDQMEHDREQRRLDQNELALKGQLEQAAYKPVGEASGIALVTLQGKDFFKMSPQEQQQTALQYIHATSGMTAYQSADDDARAAIEAAAIRTLSGAAVQKDISNKLTIEEVAARSGYTPEQIRDIQQEQMRLEKYEAETRRYQAENSFTYGGRGGGGGGTSRSTGRGKISIRQNGTSRDIDVHAEDAPFAGLFNREAPSFKSVGVPGIDEVAFGKYAAANNRSQQYALDLYKAVHEEVAAAAAEVALSPTNEGRESRASAAAGAIRNLADVYDQDSVYSAPLIAHAEVLLGIIASGRVGVGDGEVLLTDEQVGRVMAGDEIPEIAEARKEYNDDMARSPR
jgi:hypothetical protein